MISEKILFKIKSRKFWLEIVLGVLAFVLPLVVLLILFAMNGYHLTGRFGTTIVMFDMQSQYISLLRDFRDLLISGRSIVYTTNRTFGGDYLSIYTFYLASPFNLLTVFLKEADLPAFFAWSNIVKMSLASLNMYLLLKFSSKEMKIGYVGFGFAYGLISYSLVEMHNFMWLDCVMIFPLIILGIKYLEEGKFHWIYALSLAYALLTTWYLGALVCIFVVLFVLYRVFAIEGGDKNQIAFLLRFAASSLVGGLLAASFWIPAFAHLSGTKATGAMPYDSIFFPISMFFSGFLTNNFVDPYQLTINSGYATMFTSVITLVFFQLYFLNKSFSKNERYSALVLFIVFFFIMSSNQLNALFHGGQEPTWFPARYSFIVGFFVCYIGGLSFSKMDKLSTNNVYVPLFVAVVVLLVANFVPNKFIENFGAKYYQPNVLGVALYCLCLALVALYLSIKDVRHKYIKYMELVMSIIIIALIVVSSSDGANRVLSVYRQFNYGQPYDTYVSDRLYEDGINKIKALEPEANYRMELLVNRPGNYNEVNNNPMFYSYSGLNHFSSTSKRAVTEYLQKLGYHNNTFFEKFDGGSTLAVSSLLGLKYLIDDPSVVTTNRPLYQKQYPFEQLTNITSEDKELNFYKNNYAIPLGFAANEMDLYVAEGTYVEGHGDHIYWFDHFEYQNEIFKTLVSDVLDDDNKQKDIFVPLEITNYQLANLSYTEDEWGRVRLTSTNGNAGSVTITFKEPAGGNYNLYVGDKNALDNTIYYVDNNRYELSSYWHKGLRGVAKNGYGSLHTLTINFQNLLNDFEFIPELYAEDIDVLGEYIAAIKAQASMNLKVIGGRFSYGLEGTFTVTKENQALYFTLPFEKYFKVYIDGKAMKSETMLNVFIGTRLTNIGLGEHTIKIVYTDTSFIFGIIATFVGIGGLVGIIIFEKKYKKKEKPSVSE